MKTVMAILLALGLIPAAGAFGADEGDQKTVATNAAVAIKPQTECPVMEGEKINKKLYVDSDGKRIYVCCRSCVRAVTKDPAKYIKKLQDAGITLDETPVQKKE